MAKRRYTEAFQIVETIPIKNSTGGIESNDPVIRQSGLAYIDDRIRAKADPLLTGVELNNSVSFEFYKSNSYEIDLSMKVVWRGKTLNIQSVTALPDVRKIKVICSHGS